MYNNYKIYNKMYIYKTVKINKYILGKVKDYGFTQICFLK